MTANRNGIYDRNCPAINKQRKIERKKSEKILSDDASVLKLAAKCKSSTC